MGLRHTSQQSTVRARMLRHPGRFNPVRIHSQHDVTARHIRLSLEPGQTLFDAIVAPLAARGITSASTTILGGLFNTLSYCVAPPDPTGKAVIAYSQPIDAGQSYMIFGNATLGVSAQGKPLVHCHATIRTAQGLYRGGHILPEAAIVGPQPISVLVTGFSGFSLRQSFDPETNIPLLQPFRDSQP
jgi:predicted DNA-binding protein with PD1-like motif